MTNDIKLNNSLDDITSSLRSFIGLSLRKDDKTWAEWIDSVAKEIEVRCWEEKSCSRTDCPAYKSECGRCWLIAGSLCSSNGTAKGPDGIANCIDGDDTDGDGFTDAEEFLCDSDPNNSNSKCSRGMPWLLLLLDD